MLHVQGMSTDCNLYLILDHIQDLGMAAPDSWVVQDILAAVVDMLVDIPGTVDSRNMRQVAGWGILDNQGILVLPLVAVEEVHSS